MLYGVVMLQSNASFPFFTAGIKDKDRAIEIAKFERRSGLYDFVFVEGYEGETIKETIIDF